MPKPLKEFAQQVLLEHGRGEKIRRALEHGFRIAKDHPDSASWRRKSTRRAIAWENAVAKLIELLEGDPGVKTIYHHDTVSFIFDNAILIRIKKADFALRSRNVSTEQAELFHDHQVDLFGFEGLQRVEAVYVPNRFETAAIWTGIVAREKRIHLWDLEFAPPSSGTVVPLPIPGPTLPTADLARLKPQRERDRKAGDK